MEEIGRRLQAAREARGITLQVAEDETKIRRKYLEALETGSIVDIPGEAYLKGFLRTYGNYLGLDGAGLVEEYKRLADPAPAQGPKAPEPVAKPVVKLLERKPEAPAVRSAERREPDRATARRAAQVASRQDAVGQDTALLRLVGSVALALVVLGALGYGGWRLVKPAAAPKSNNTPPVSTVTDPPKPVTVTDPPKPEPPKITMTRGQVEDVIFTVAGVKDIQVRLEFGAERVWMKATVDGQDKYEGFPNAPLDFSGSQVRLRMGLMDGISLIINGQRFDHKLSKGPYTLIFQKQ